MALKVTVTLDLDADEGTFMTDTFVHLDVMETGVHAGLFFVAEADKKTRYPVERIVRVIEEGGKWRGGPGGNQTSIERESNSPSA